MNKRLLVLSALGLSAISLALYSRWNGESSQAASSASPLSSPGASSASSSAAAVVVAQSPRNEAKIPAPAQREIERCLKASHEEKRSDELMRLLESPAQAGVAKKMRYRNFHIELPSGERQRIQLFEDSNADGKNIVRLRLFREDAEGLPEPLQVPAEHQSNPAASVVHSYLERGKVTFSESAWSGALSGGSAMEWIERNGRTEELHLVSASASLGCATQDERGLECDCRL